MFIVLSVFFRVCVVFLVDSSCEGFQVFFLYFFSFNCLFLLVRVGMWGKVELTFKAFRSCLIMSSNLLQFLGVHSGSHDCVESK